MKKEANTTVHEEEVNPFFDAWGRFVLGHRWLLLALTLTITAAMAHQVLTCLRIDNSVKAFTSSKDQTNVVLDEFHDDFGRDDLVLVLVEGDVFSLPYLERLRKLHRAIEKLDVKISSDASQDDSKTAPTTTAPGPAQPAPPTATTAEPPVPLPITQVGDVQAVEDDLAEDDLGEFGDEVGSADDDFSTGETADAWAGEQGGSVVSETISLINARDTSYEGGSLQFGELMDPMPSADQLPALKERVLADRSLVGNVIGSGGRHSVIVVTMQTMSEEDSAEVSRRIEAVAKDHEIDGFETKVAGPPALNEALNDLMLNDLQKTGLIAMAVMLLLLFILFRNVIMIAAPLGVVVQAAIWTFGAMAMVDLPMTMLSNILPAFLVCVGIGDSVHLQAVYRDDRAEGASNDEAIRYAIATTGVPVLFTTLTTMVGLLSFRMASVDAIGDMGTMGAWGVFIALVHSLVFLPIALSFNSGPMVSKQEQDASLLNRFLDFLTNLSDDGDANAERGLSLRRTPRRTRTLLAMVVLTLAAAAAASTLYVYHNPLSWIPPEYPIWQAFDQVDKHIGGTATAHIVVDTGRPEGIKNLDLLQQLKKLEGHIAAYDPPSLKAKLVGNSMSILDVIRETNRAFHKGDPAFYRLPDTDRELADLMFMFESAGSDQLRRLATNDLSKTRMTFRIRWMDATAYGPFASHVEEGIEKYMPDDVSVQPTGTAYSLLSTISSLVWDLVRSFGLAFIVITFMMIAMLRSVRLGLIGMVPNLLPILVIMGVMGAFDVPIDMVNLLIASIAIGIAVDDTIHYLHHFKVHYDVNGQVEAAIHHTVKHAGRAMLSTSLILCLGFLVYVTADMYNTQRFGTLVALTVVFALLIDMVFAPALLRAIYRDRPPATASTPPREPT